MVIYQMPPVRPLTLPPPMFKPVRPNKQRPSGVEFGKGVDAQLHLLPEGTPFMLLHGTNTFGTVYDSVQNFLNDKIRTVHPVYVSDVEEIRYATGISTPARGHVPATRQVLNDSASFAMQLAARNLVGLRHATKDPLAQEKTIDFFNLPRTDTPYGLETEVLLPILIQWAQSLWDPSKPSNLMNTAQEGVSSLEDVARKLALEPKGRIIDTHCLAVARRKAGDAKASVNIRPIQPDLIERFEGQLDRAQTQLAEKLAHAYQTQSDPYRKKDMYPTATREAINRKAQKIAEAVINRIVPASVICGHSQGGTVAVRATLDTLTQSKTPFIKMVLAFNAPLSGVSDEPPCFNADKAILIRIFGERNWPRIREWLWKIIGKGRPAIGEMRNNSPFMIQMAQQLAEQQPELKRRGMTLMAIPDLSDQFVRGDKDAMLPIPVKPAPNLFNIIVNSPPEGDTARAARDLEVELQDFSIGGSLDTVIQQLTRLSKDRQQQARGAFIRRYEGLSQHRASIQSPAFIWTELSKRFLKDTPAHLQALDPGNFEAFRAQLLRARRGIFRRHIGNSNNQAQALERLQQFLKTYQGYLTLVLTNAQDAVPIITAASFQANLLLTQTLDFLGPMVANPSNLKPKDVQFIRQILKEIAQANLLPMGEVDISQRANQMHEQLEANQASMVA